MLNREVALKVLAPHLADQATARERFAREARAAAVINHENVLSIHAVSEAAGLPYLVMPYIVGRSLAEKLEREGRLPLAEVLNIGMQVALGLAAAHERGVVHRDVKPPNVLLEGDGERVKIADFGLATVLDGASLTLSGTLAGTPEFMAPEQAREEPIDGRCDLFSLGAVLYLLATGRSPFQAATPLATLRRVCDDTPPPVTQLNAGTTAWFAALVERLLQKNPADRYQTAAEVAESLRHQLAAVGEPRRPVPRVVAASILNDFARDESVSDDMYGSIPTAACIVPHAIQPAPGVVDSKAPITLWARAWRRSRTVLLFVGCVLALFALNSWQLMHQGNSKDTSSKKPASANAHKTKKVHPTPQRPAHANKNALHEDSLPIRTSRATSSALQTILPDGWL
jgi:serine/threonine protein kinase